MADPMRVRATLVSGSTDVRVLMSHPMDTGQVKDAEGKVIPAHYITAVTVSHNGKTVLSSTWGAAISKNPYLAFKFKGGAKGDKVAVTWTDNKGDKRTDTSDIT